MSQITQLADNEVFVFGSNSTGFSGAGSAGLACRGDARNTWRSDSWFLAAMKSPVGSPNRIGKWAVYGVARGYQVGREGRSYAIETIKHPGMRRTIPLSVIEDQLKQMFVFARENPNLRFLMTPVGAGYAGYTDGEMRGVWDRVKEAAPSNVVAPKDLYQSSKVDQT